MDKGLQNEARGLLLKAVLEAFLSEQEGPLDLFVCDPEDMFDEPLSEDWLPGPVEQSVLGLRESVTLEPVLEAFRSALQPSNTIVFCPFTNGRRQAKLVASDWLVNGEKRWRGAESSLTTIIDAFPAKDHCAVLILPAQLFVGRSFSRVRAKLMDSGLLRCLVEMDDLFPVLFERGSPYPRFTLCVLDSGKKDGFVRIWRAPDRDVVAQRAHSDLERLLNQGGGQTTFGFVLRDGVDECEPLTFASCHPQLMRETALLAEFGGQRVLGEVCDVFIGGLPSKFESERKRGAGRRQFLVSGAHIGSDGSFNLVGAKTFQGKIRERDVLREGDLCIGLFFSEGGLGGLRVGRVTQDFKKYVLVASDKLVVVRFDRPVS